LPEKSSSSSGINSIPPFTITKVAYTTS
jgi:hypothetical protein